MTLRKLACAVVCLIVLSGCNTQPGTFDKDQAQACKDRGGVPVSIFNGHLNTTTVCFAPEVLR